MYWTYGTYQADDLASEVTLRIETLLSERGIPYAQVWMASVRGYLSGNGQAENTIAATTLQDVLRVPYKDFILRHADGTPSHVTMRNAASITGVIAQGPNFPDARGAEFATYRRYEFTVRAEYPITPGANAILAWTETISITGNGGPRFVVKHAIVGPPQRQQISQATVVHATQQGRSVGYINYIAVPPPIWPDAELPERRVVTPTSPKMRGRGFQDFAVSWAYQFESAVPLGGLPTAK